MIARLPPAPPADQPIPRTVVVTGPHRSGTTVMGALLGHAPGTLVVHEPLNVDWGLDGVDTRYPHLTAADTEHPTALVLRNWLTVGDGTWRMRGRPRSARGPRVRERRRVLRRARRRGHTVIVKDPFLLLALEWVGTALSDRPTVVTLRHPGAWVASLRRRGMHPGAALRAFRAADGFGDPEIRELLARRRWEQTGLAGAGAATWAVLVRMLDRQLAAGAPARVVRMEDFAADPTVTLLDLYARTGLRAPDHLDRVVQEYTGRGNVVSPDRSVMHELRRDSAALVHAWRSQLTDRQQARVRAITAPFAGAWYPEW